MRPTPTRPPPGTRVLLVSGDGVLLRDLGARLAALGCVVTVLPPAEAAARDRRDHPLDIVLLDLGAATKAELATLASSLGGRG